ncbi:flagellar biosynthesis protein FlhG [Variovorax sp. J22R115]|uniref:MinD/ParA family ATP-binding protein n=1 Tax=Variovorax sp. J22R115 TaxID=3053509 RepID=UPI0025772F28|nr:flagellar biosynthesis protein FlhG [Variovorax sp. J22R115]MDM0052375.1 flagellar biosynthesis protein FlhG [Variovorax sp. J22R115]
MSKLVADQADGLRRLLSRTPTRIVAVAGIARGDGATTTAMNLGAALVHQGKDVLLLDEHGPAADSVCAVWGLDPLGSLADVADRRLTRDSAVARSGCGVAVLPALPGVPHADADPRLLCHGGVILIDAAFDGEGRLSSLARLADELVLVLQPNAASITSAYAGIKRLHYAHGLKQLRFLVNAVSSVEEAQKVTANLANTGSRYLAVSLEPAGWVRADPHLADARRLGETVVEAFPASPAAVDFRRIAGDLGRWPWRIVAPGRTKSIENSEQAPRAATVPARSAHASGAVAA